MCSTLTRASDGAVQDVGAVGGPDDEDHLSRTNAVDLRENLVDHSDKKKKQRNTPGK